MAEEDARILIIEDEPESVRLLLEFLRDYYPDIMVARSGPDGLEKARRGAPDLILLDMGMPGMDGLEVCRRLKADARTQPIPVIFLTAYAFVEDKLRAFEAGAVDYITKPFSDREVLARIGVHSRVALRRQWIETRADGIRDDMELSGRLDRDATIFTRACDLLQEHLSESTTLTALARELGTTERRLDSIFRARLGFSAFDYLSELRMSVARRMLIEPGLQVKQIAWKVGYANPGDFSRAFRKRFGMTPRSFREGLAGDGNSAFEPER